MIDQPPRLKKVTIYLSGEHRAQRKSHPKIFNFAQWSDVKSCAVRMFNVMLGMTLKVQGIRNINNGHQTNHTPFIIIIFFICLIYLIQKKFIYSGYS